MAPSHHYCCDDCKANGTAQRYYKSQYGMTLKEVQQLHKDHNGVCAICKEVGFKLDESIMSTLNIDHCHKTGAVRGLLCPNCNRALGLCKDSIERLKSAISCLEGATTISKESTYKCTEAHNVHNNKDDDIV